MAFEDNHELTKSLVEGNVEAFTYLVNTYHQPLCNYAYGLSGDHAQAKDVVQNILLKLWEKRYNLDPEQSLKSLLYRSVHNEYIDQYRKSKSLNRLETLYHEQLTNLYVEEESDSTQVLHKMVKEAIKNLPPQCNRVFELSKFEGLTNEEISAYLGISVKAVENQITKGFSTIRKTLSNKLSTILFLLYK